MLCILFQTVTIRDNLPLIGPIEAQIMESFEEMWAQGSLQRGDIAWLAINNTMFFNVLYYSKYDVRSTNYNSLY